MDELYNFDDTILQINSVQFPKSQLLTSLTILLSNVEELKKNLLFSIKRNQKLLNILLPVGKFLSTNDYPNH